MCCCTPPGTFQVYGQTRPILIQLPSRAIDAASRSGSRSSTKTRCSMCQSCGCSVIAASKTVASCWVIAAICSCLVPSAGTGISGWMWAPQHPPSYHSVTGISAAPVCTASAAEPPIILAFSPKKSTSMPAPVTSRSASRQTRPPARSRWASTPNLLTPPVAGSTSMPRLSRKATNLLVHRLGLEPLGHRGEAVHAAGDDPGAGVFPVAHVRQREDHPAAGRHVGHRRLLLAGAAHVGQDPVAADHRQPEHLEPVPRVGPHPLRGTGPAAACRWPRARRPGAGCPPAPAPAAPAGARRCRRRT